VARPPYLAAASIAAFSHSDTQRSYCSACVVGLNVPQLTASHYFDQFRVSKNMSQPVQRSNNVRM